MTREEAVEILLCSPPTMNHGDCRGTGLTTVVTPATAPVDPVTREYVTVAFCKGEGCIAGKMANPAYVEACKVLGIPYYLRDHLSPLRSYDLDYDP